jgi:hypothetical protein
MNPKANSPAKPEGSHGRKFVSATTKRTLRGDVRWIAQAAINEAHFVLGTWANSEDAATAFDRAVLHYRGAGARVAPGDCSPRAGPLNESLPWWLFTKRQVGSADRNANSAKKSRRRYSGTSDRSTRCQSC